MRSPIPTRPGRPERTIRAAPSRAPERPRFRVVGLFAGIGGFELGLQSAGHHTELLCELEPVACHVLSARFPSVSLVHDVRDLRSLPRADVVVAGFPCQDLSQAGRTAGIRGARSSLVGEVFRLLEAARPRWLVLENVPFMLSLDQGRAMRFLTSSLERLGFDWAYRVVDTQSFGLPQRRLRVLLVASRSDDPRNVVLANDAREPPLPSASVSAYGFYWTEGTKGLGWAVDAVPTLKGGSTLGIPSPPAIWTPSARTIVTPDLRDAERLQGFPADWTAPAVVDPARRNTPRWKLVGNAVSVPVAEWLGHCLAAPGAYDASNDRPLRAGDRWPAAAWCLRGERHVAEVSPWPVCVARPRLLDFLAFPTRDLSARATDGFLRRAESSSLRFAPRFLAEMRAHSKRMQALRAA